MKRFIYWFKLFFPITILCVLASTFLFYLSGDYKKFYLTLVPTVAAVLFTFIESRGNKRKLW